MVEKILFDFIELRAGGGFKDKKPSTKRKLKH
jgi:hypothetical protein